MDVIRRNKNGFLFIVTILIGLFIWLAPRPDGVTEQAWNLFAVFVATVVGIILKPLPMGAIALLSLTFLNVSKILTFAQAFSGFSNSVVWLIVAAFFIARGFIQTGLGSRVGYFFMKLFGKSTLGLSYSLVATEFILAPTIPSLTARVGGILFPILKSMAKAFGSEPFDPSSRKVGAFLTMVTFQGSAITSAMFLTSMAGNPLVADLAANSGVTISWGSWILASIVPGLCSLLFIPYFIYKVFPPEIKETPHAYAYAQKHLEDLGKMKSNEWIMCGTFFLLIFLWIFGSYVQINATVVALIGLSILLLTGVLKWKDIIQESGAWDTLFWFAALITMASYLNEFGMMTWFSNFVVGNVQGMNWIYGFLILSILYFYTHYFFASNLAHISAMYAPFLIVAIAIGTPPVIAAMILAFYSSLFGGLTHYGCGPAPILFGAGYVPIGQWWKMGFFVSVVNIVIWMGIGGLWWKVLGLW